MAWCKSGLLGLRDYMKNRVILPLKHLDTKKLLYTQCYKNVYKGEERKGCTVKLLVCYLLIF